MHPLSYRTGFIIYWRIISDSVDSNAYINCGRNLELFFQHSSKNLPKLWERHSGSLVLPLSHAVRAAKQWKACWNNLGVIFVWIHDMRGHLHTTITKWWLLISPTYYVCSVHFCPNLPLLPLFPQPALTFLLHLYWPCSYALFHYSFYIFSSSLFSKYMRLTLYYLDAVLVNKYVWNENALKYTFLQSW